MGKITRQELAPVLRQELDDVQLYIDGSNNVAYEAHMQNTSNPHQVDASQVGLGNLLNERQATKAEFDTHVANTSNPHGVTTAQIGAVPTSRLVSAGTGLSGGGSLGLNRTLSLDTSYTDSRYVRKSGGRIDGVFEVSGEIRLHGNTAFNAPLRSNGNNKQVSVGTGANDVYVTNSRSGKYLQLKDNGELSYSSNRIYHGGNLRFGTSNPSGGSHGDIYIQY